MPRMTKAQRAERRAAAVETATRILKEDEQYGWVLFTQLVLAWDDMDTFSQIGVHKVAVETARLVRENRELRARLEALEGDDEDDEPVRVAPCGRLQLNPEPLKLVSAKHCARCGPIRGMHQDGCPYVGMDEKEQADASTKAHRSMGYAHTSSICRTCTKSQ